MKIVKVYKVVHKDIMINRMMQALIEIKTEVEVEVGVGVQVEQVRRIRCL